MEEMADKTGREHLEALKEVHRALGKLRDPDIGSGNSVYELLLEFEEILRRKGMPEVWLLSLRQKEWRRHAEIIQTLGKSRRGGRGHVSVSGGLPSLGKRR
jgi:hypothetical protein